MVDTPSGAPRLHWVAGLLPLSSAYRRLCDHGRHGHAHRRRGVRHGGGDRFGGLQLQGKQMVGGNHPQWGMGLPATGAIQNIFGMCPSGGDFGPVGDYRWRRASGNFLVADVGPPSNFLRMVAFDRVGPCRRYHPYRVLVGCSRYADRRQPGAGDKRPANPPWRQRDFDPVRRDRGVVC